MEERMGAAVDDGQALAVVGRPIEPGDPAPDFSLDLFTGCITAPAAWRTPST